MTKAVQSLLTLSSMSCHFTPIYTYMLCVINQRTSCDSKEHSSY